MGRQKYPRPRVGDRYGAWTVLSVPVPMRSYTQLLCRCTCGQTGTPNVNSLVSGKSTRCNAYRVQKFRTAGSANLKYGFIPVSHRTRLRKCVEHAISRCYNPDDPGYARYGGRGITVFESWYRDRSLFLRYLITIPEWDNTHLTIDRINNDGNYEPGNVRWITHRENQQNKSGTDNSEKPKEQV